MLHSAGMSLGVQGVNLFLGDKITPTQGGVGGRAFRPRHEEKADRKRRGGIPLFSTALWKTRKVVMMKKAVKLRLADWRGIQFGHVMKAPTAGCFVTNIQHRGTNAEGKCVRLFVDVSVPLCFCVCLH